MKTLFRKLIVPLVFLMSALAATSASATLYKVTDYAVYKFNGGHVGYVKVTGADCVGFNCYFQLNALGTSMVMALATAKQMQIGIYLHGNSVDGSGIYSLADSGRLVQGVELFRDPATFGAISPNMPISIYADASVTQFYSTCIYNGGYYGCKNGGYPGYTRGWRFNQLITTDTWFNTYGYAYPVAALSTLYNAFSNQFGVTITGTTEITDIYSDAKCGTWSGQCM